MSFRYASTPQAKGNIERAHHYWQQRLPAYFASESIREWESANAHLQALRLHRNQHEVHRKLGMTPQAAWEGARKDKRSALRVAPRCPWWSYVWSERKTLKVAADGRVPIGGQAVRLEVAPGTGWCSATIPAATTRC